MEVLGQLAGGFATALQPVNLIFLLIGVTLGLVIGVLPGLGGTSGVAILLTTGLVVAKVARAEPSGPCVIFIGEAFADAMSLPRTQIKLERSLVSSGVAE